MEYRKKKHASPFFDGSPLPQRRIVSELAYLERKCGRRGCVAGDRNTMPKMTGIGEDVHECAREDFS